MDKKENKQNLTFRKIDIRNIKAKKSGKKVIILTIILGIIVIILASYTVYTKIICTKCNIENSVYLKLNKNI